MANIHKFQDKDFRNEGMEVDFNLEKVFNIPSIEVSRFHCLTLLSKWSSCTWTLTSAGNKLSGMKISVQHHQWINVIQWRARKKRLIWWDAIPKTLSLNRSVWMLSMMQENVCLRWRDRWGFASLKSTSLKNVSTTQLLSPDSNL